jgi:hypothetical protein
MKTKSKTQTSSPRSQAVSIIGLTIVTFLAIILSSCSDNDAVNPDTRQQFIGSYNVEDISAATGTKYNYNVDIDLGSKGDLELSNFGGVMNVPVKAKLDGNLLTVSSQTFTNPNGSTLTVSGTGTFTGVTLTFTYTLSGYGEYTGNCVATRSE